MIMLLNDTLTLISRAYYKDPYGIQRETETTKEIFCDASSIGATEFYEAAQTGLRPEYRFIVLDAEYSGETLVRFHGTDLNVYRTYRRSLDYIELYTSRRQGVNGGSDT